MEVSNALIDQYCQQIARGEAVSPHNIYENLALRQAVTKAFRQGTMPSRIVFTNLKVFASEGAPLFYRKMLEHDIQDIKSKIDIEFSAEDPSHFQHDFVGFLEILSKRRKLYDGQKKMNENADISGKSKMSHGHGHGTVRMRCLSTDTDSKEEEDIRHSHEHVILDGGRKSRNYLLTLFHQYQGMYGLISHCTWRASMESGTAIQSQLPAGGDEWMILSSSDYDLVPADCRVGGKPLAELPDSADFVFFVLPLPAHLQRILLSCRTFVLERIAGLESMGNGEAYDAIMDLYETLSDGHENTENNISIGDLYHLAELLMRLSSKGIAVAREDGRLNFFEEKPTIAKILVHLCQMGTLCENIMYASFKKRILDSMLDLFSVQSDVSPELSLREAVPFGFYETLAGMSFLECDVWVSMWNKRRPKNANANANADAWANDGRKIWRLGRELVKDKEIYLCFLGEESRVGDIGVPGLYARALLLRAFTPLGRLTSSLPLENSGVEVVDCVGYDPDRITVVIHEGEGEGEDENANVLLLRSSFSFSGSGKIVIHASSESKVLIMDSIVHVADGQELVIGSITTTHMSVRNRSIAGGDEDEPALYVIASSYVSGGGRVSGKGGAMVFGFDSRKMIGSSGATIPLPLVVVAPCEVVTTLSIKDKDDSSSASASNTHRFSALLAVNRAGPGCSRTPLNYRMFSGGRTFVEAQRDTDLARVEKRLAEVRDGNIDVGVAADAQKNVEVDWFAEFNKCVESRTQCFGGCSDPELRECIVQAVAEYIVDPFIGGYLSLAEVADWILVRSPSQSQSSDLIRRYWILDYFLDVLRNGGWLNASNDMMRVLLDACVDMSFELSSGSGVDVRYSKAELIRRFHHAFRIECPETHRHHESVRVFGASGRVNGGGAHTDWTYHSVFGFALSQRVYCAAKKLDVDGGEGEGVIHVYSHDMASKYRRRVVRLDVDDLKIDKAHPMSWSNYIIGCVLELKRRFGSRSIPSMALYISSDLPMGCGLSSSAAIECVVTTAILKLNDWRLCDNEGESEGEGERVELAMLCNRVENSYVGVGSGVLDQGCVALGKADHLVFFECRENRTKLLNVLPSPLSKLGYSIVLINTGVRRHLQSHSDPDGYGPIPIVPFYEAGVSDFNRRVNRYWIGVCIITGMSKFKFKKIVLDDGLSLKSDPIQLEECIASLRVDLGIASFILCSESEYDGLKQKLRVECGCGRSSSNKRQRMPIVMTIDTGNADSKYMFGGVCESVCTCECSEYGDRICSIDVVLDMVRYAIRENARVQLVSSILSNEQSAGEGEDETKKRLREWAVSEIRRHAALHEMDEDEVGSERALIEHKLASKIAAADDDDTSSLSEMERILAFGLFGDISWEDKRDLFRGDSPHHAIQATYDCVETAIKKEGDPFGVLGKCCPGAGFGGVSCVLVKDCYVDLVKDAIATEYRPRFSKYDDIDERDINVYSAQISDGIIEL